MFLCRTTYPYKINKITPWRFKWYINEKELQDLYTLIMWNIKILLLGVFYFLQEKRNDDQKNDAPIGLQLLLVMAIVV